MLFPIVSIVLMINSQTIDGYRILGMFPLHGRSHFVMVEGLLRNLAKRGHQVDVVSHFPLNEKLDNYKDISIKGSIPAIINNMSAENVKEFSASFSLTHFTKICGDEICELMKLPQMQQLINDPPKNPPYDIIIVEVFAFPCYLAFGRHLNATMVGVVTNGLLDWLYHQVGVPHNPSYIPSIFSSFTKTMDFKNRLFNTFQSHIIIEEMTYLLAKQSSYVEKFFGPNQPSISEFYRDLDLLLINSHHSLSGIKPTVPAVIEVGGLHVKDGDQILPPELKTWIEQSKDGVILFTFGSMVRVETFPTEILQALYRAFEKISPVRVLMKVAKKEDLPAGLPSNVRTGPWLPQLAILKHPNVRAFITHGGLMGTTEAVVSGVPMIGIPLFGDQKINIQNYVHKKVAVSLGDIYDLTEDKITNALNTVLKDPTYKENIKKLSTLFNDRPMSAMDTAIYWVEYVGRHGKVLQSPVVHLSWFQRNLIDVYGFVAICVGLILVILYCILKKIKNCICGRKTSTGTKKNN